jgi:predicted ABC-type ATPase
VLFALADEAAIYDNGGKHRVLIAEKESGLPLVIRDREHWSRIKELTPWK